jgi:hypothetical protein
MTEDSSESENTTLKICEFLQFISALALHRFTSLILVSGTIMEQEFDVTDSDKVVRILLKSGHDVLFAA